MNKKARPLYRKVNTRTHGVRHVGLSRFKYTKNKKKETPEQVYGTMFGTKRHGRDYTPLFKFLLSKVGGKWDEIHSEAVSRLDSSEPINWMVAKDRDDANEIVRTNENSYFSGLYVDQEKVLRKTNPDLSAKTMEPFCECCTHTFNGIVFGND